MEKIFWFIKVQLKKWENNNGTTGRFKQICWSGYETVV